MTEVDQLKISVEKEIQDCDEFLNQAKEILGVVPLVQERRQEAEAKMLTLNQMPEDLLAESAPRLLNVQLYDQGRLETYLPKLPQINRGLTQHYLPSGVAGTAFYDAAVAGMQGQTMTPPWLMPVNDAFGSLAVERSRKATLPEALNKLQPNLGEIFQAAVDSIEKSKAGILGIDQASIRMRDVIQQAWGGLAEHTRRRSGKGLAMRLEISRSIHRTQVATSLSRTGEVNSLVLILDNLATLHSELSVFSKNPLIKNIDDLNILVTRWFLYIEQLSKLLDL